MGLAIVMATALTTVQQFQSKKCWQGSCCSVHSVHSRVITWKDAVQISLWHIIDHLLMQTTHQHQTYQSFILTTKQDWEGDMKNLALLTASKTGNIKKLFKIWRLLIEFKEYVSLIILHLFAGTQWTQHLLHIQIFKSKLSRHKLQGLAKPFKGQIQIP